MPRTFIILSGKNLFEDIYLTFAQPSRLILVKQENRSDLWSTEKYIWVNLGPLWSKLGVSLAATLCHSSKRLGIFFDKCWVMFLSRWKNESLRVSKPRRSVCRIASLNFRNPLRIAWIRVSSSCLDHFSYVKYLRKMRTPFRFPCCVVCQMFGTQNKRHLLARNNHHRQLRNHTDGL